MKTILKRVVMWLYCHDVINSYTALRLFNRFGLWGA